MHPSNTNAVNWGELYYDHYDRFLNSPVAREVFQQDVNLPSIQVLIYDNVYSGCRLFCTLGLSHYQSTTQEIGELCIVTNTGWEHMPYLLANVSYFIVQHEMHLGWGMGIGGINSILSSFSDMFNKSAVYISQPFSFPNDFYQINGEKEVGRIYLLNPISQNEYTYFLDYGSTAFEEHLETMQVDPFDLNRESSI